MIQTVAESPKISRLKHNQQEMMPSTPAKGDLTNGEPESTENGDQKPEKHQTSSVSGK